MWYEMTVSFSEIQKYAKLLVEAFFIADLINL